MIFRFIQISNLCQNCHFHSINNKVKSFVISWNEMDRSMSSRVGMANESELNVRDDVQEDDEDFFHANSYEEGRAPAGEQHRQQFDSGSSNNRIVEDGTAHGSDWASDKENCRGGSTAVALPGHHPPPSVFSSAASSRRYASNLSKITEAPDEFSFSFKQAVTAVQMFNRDHEELEKQNYLRLPSMSFHASQYSMKHSWEESALRHHNATISSFGRSELHLSMNQAPVKDKSISEQPEQYQSPEPFLSGTRCFIYFGFCRLGFESEQTLLVRNVHPNKERVQIKCVWKNPEKEKYFKVLQPVAAGEREEQTQVLSWDRAAKVIIGFTPPAESYYKNILKIECKSRKETREYFFLVHGYGGRALVEPVVEGRSASLCFSANGQYQLVVRSASKFHFALKNRGQRSAFASLLFYYPNGLEIPSNEIIANMRNLLLSREGLPEPFTKVIEIRYLGPVNSPSGRAQSVASGSPDSAREISLKIAIIWGEEKQRQRLKRFEKKEMTKGNLCVELKNFGQNFTIKRNFDGEQVELSEPYISEEEYYCFDKQTRVTFINIIERSQAAAMAIERSSSSTMVPYQQRTGSALSVVSGSAEGRRELRAHQTIVDVDPDNTLTVVGAGVNVLDDDTLT